MLGRELANDTYFFVINAEVYVDNFFNLESGGAGSSVRGIISLPG